MNEAQLTAFQAGSGIEASTLLLAIALPEAITQADSFAGCHEEAAGALQAAIEGRIMDGLEIPGERWAYPS